MKAITLHGPGDVRVESVPDQAGRLTPRRIITHTMPLGDAPRGYAIFDRKEGRAIKVMLKP